MGCCETKPEGVVQEPALDPVVPKARQAFSEQSSTKTQEPVPVDNGQAKEPAVVIKPQEESESEPEEEIEDVDCREGWTEHISPDGYKYYYHKENNTSSWEPPEPWKTEEQKAADAAAAVELKERQAAEAERQAEEAAKLAALKEQTEREYEEEKAALEETRRVQEERRRANEERISRERSRRRTAIKERRQTKVLNQVTVARRLALAEDARLLADPSTLSLCVVLRGAVLPQPRRAASSGCVYVQRSRSMYRYHLSGGGGGGAQQQQQAEGEGEGEGEGDAMPLAPTVRDLKLALAAELGYKRQCVRVYHRWGEAAESAPLRPLVAGSGSGSGALLCGTASAPQPLSVFLLGPPTGRPSLARPRLSDALRPADVAAASVAAAQQQQQQQQRRRLLSAVLSACARDWTLEYRAATAEASAAMEAWRLALALLQERQEMVRAAAEEARRSGGGGSNRQSASHRSLVGSSSGVHNSSAVGTSGLWIEELSAAAAGDGGDDSVVAAALPEESTWISLAGDGDDNEEEGAEESDEEGNTGAAALSERRVQRSLAAAVTRSSRAERAVRLLLRDFDRAAALAAAAAVLGGAVPTQGPSACFPPVGGGNGGGSGSGVGDTFPQWSDAMGCGGRKWLLGGLLLREASDWTVCGHTSTHSSSPLSAATATATAGAAAAAAAAPLPGATVLQQMLRGSSGRKLCGQEHRGLGLVRGASVPGLEAPLSAVVDIAGVRLLVTTVLPPTDAVQLPAPVAPLPAPAVAGGSGSGSGSGDGGDAIAGRYGDDCSVAYGSASDGLLLRGDPTSADLAAARERAQAVHATRRRNSNSGNAAAAAAAAAAAPEVGSSGSDEEGAAAAEGGATTDAAAAAAAAAAAHPDSGGAMCADRVACAKAHALAAALNLAPHAATERLTGRVVTLALPYTAALYRLRDSDGDGDGAGAAAAGAASPSVRERLSRKQGSDNPQNDAHPRRLPKLSTTATAGNATAGNATATATAAASSSGASGPLSSPSHLRGRDLSLAVERQLAEREIAELSASPQEMEEAAVAMQSVFRGHVARREVAVLRQEQQQKATGAAAAGQPAGGAGGASGDGAAAAGGSGAPLLHPRYASDHEMARSRHVLPCGAGRLMPCDPSPAPRIADNGMFLPFDSDDSDCDDNGAAAAFDGGDEGDTASAGAEDLGLALAAAASATAADDVRGAAGAAVAQSQCRLLFSGGSRWGAGGKALSAADPLPLVRRLRPELVASHGAHHLNSSRGGGDELEPGWTLFTSLEPVHCDECGNMVTAFTYWGYPRRRYTCCTPCHTRLAPKERLKFPVCRVTRCRVPAHLRVTYWRRDRDGAVSLTPPRVLTPLNPDAFRQPLQGRHLTSASLTVGSAPGKRQLRAAAAALHRTVLPSLVEGLNTLQLCPRSGSELCEEVHRAGANLRYLGVLAAQARLPHVRQLLLVEMLSRCVKHVARDVFRAALWQQQGAAAATGSSSGSGDISEAEVAELAASAASALAYASPASATLAVLQQRQLLGGESANEAAAAAAGATGLPALSLPSDVPGFAGYGAEDGEGSAAAAAAAASAPLVIACAPAVDADLATAAAKGEGSGAAQARLRALCATLLNALVGRQGQGREGDWLWDALRLHCQARFCFSLERAACAELHLPALLTAAAAKMGVKLRGSGSSSGSEEGSGTGGGAAGFDFSGPAPLRLCDVLCVRPVRKDSGGSSSGGGGGGAFHSALLQSLLEQAGALDAAGRCSAWHMAGGAERAQASALYRDAVRACSSIYGPRHEETGRAHLVLAQQLESRHAERGRPEYSRWNRCFNVSDDALSREARDAYKAALGIFQALGGGEGEEGAGGAGEAEEEAPSATSPAGGGGGGGGASLTDEDSLSLDCAECYTGLARLSKDESNQYRVVDFASEPTPHCASLSLLYAAHRLTLRVCGPRHPESAELCMTIALCFLDMHSLDDAAPWMRSAFLCYARCFGPRSAVARHCWAQLKQVETFMDSGLQSVPIEDLADAIQDLAERGSDGEGASSGSESESSDSDSD